MACSSVITMSIMSGLLLLSVNFVSLLHISVVSCIDLMICYVMFHLEEGFAIQTFSRLGITLFDYICPRPSASPFSYGKAWYSTGEVFVAHDSCDGHTSKFHSGFP